MFWIIVLGIINFIELHNKFKTNFNTTSTRHVNLPDHLMALQTPLLKEDLKRHINIKIN